MAGACWAGFALAGGGADGGFADEHGAGFDGEGLGGDVADDFGAGLEVDAFGTGEVSVDFAVDDDGSGFDFGLDVGVFTDGEVSGGGDFAFDFAVDDEVVVEIDGSLDFDVGGEDVAHGGLGRLCGGVGNGSGLLGGSGGGRRLLLRGGSGCRGARGFATVLADYFLKHGI